MVRGKIGENTNLITYIPQAAWGAVVEWVARRVAAGVLGRVP
jgi:hypothetical protein